MESVADEQHWRFQTYKYSLSAEERKTDPSTDVRHGFLTEGIKIMHLIRLNLKELKSSPLAQSGLFKYCRHPNYFAEQVFYSDIC